MGKKFIYAIAVLLGCFLLYYFTRITVTNNQLKSENKELRTKVKELGDSIGHLKNIIDTATWKLFEMQGRLDVSLTRNRVLEGENAIYRADISRYSAELSAKLRKIEELSLKKNDLENKLAISEASGVKSDQEKENIRKQLKETQTDLNTTKNENTKIKDSIDNISKKIVSVQLEYSKDGVQYFQAEYGDYVKMEDARKIKITLNTIGNVEFKVQILTYTNDNTNPQVTQRAFSNGQCVFEFANIGANTYRIDVFTQDLATTLFSINRIVVSK